MTRMAYMMHPHQTVVCKGASVTRMCSWFLAAAAAAAAAAAVATAAALQTLTVHTAEAAVAAAAAALHTLKVRTAAVVRGCFRAPLVS